MKSNNQAAWAAKKFTVRNGSDSLFEITVSGRKRWTLEMLIEAKSKGLSSTECGAPRLSAYIYDIRGLGVHIETTNERHGGSFKGYHARYCLKSLVESAELVGADHG